jgi:membrane protein DedA with SNARE-associated domain
LVGAASFSAVVSAMPTALAVAVLCVAVVAEIVAVPAVLLPGGTMTLLAGALIGSGRPAAEVVVPMTIAVLSGDQLAYFFGGLVVGWWRSRRPDRAKQAPPPRRGRAAKWLTATMPSLAGAARMPYREFVPRLLVMRVPWLAAAFAAGTLAAHSLREIGHVAGIAGLIVSAIVVIGLFLVHQRPEALRRMTRRFSTSRRP